MAVSKISRTARFFKLTAVGGDGTPFLLPRIDFAEVLRRYGQRALPNRQHEFDGYKYLFDPRGTSDRHLAIHKLRNPADFMARITADGQVTEVMAVDDDGSFADSAAVSFLPYGNSFGMVGGNVSSPRAGRVSDWLNEIQPFGASLTFSAVPVLAQPVLDALDSAAGARRVSVSLRGSSLGASDGASTLGASVRSLLDDVDDAKITLTISTGQQTPGPTLRARLMEFVRDLASNIDPAARAQAAIVHEVPAKRKYQINGGSDLVS